MTAMATTTDALTPEQAATLAAARRVLSGLEYADNPRLAQAAYLVGQSVTSLLITAKVWANSEHASAVL